MTPSRDHDANGEKGRLIDVRRLDDCALIDAETLAREFFMCSRRQVFNWLKDGTLVLDRVKLGRKLVRFRLGDVRAFCNLMHELERLPGRAEWEESRRSRTQ